MLLLALAAYLGYLVLIVLVQDWLLFPRAFVNGRAQGFPARFERIAIARDGFEVEARLLPARSGRRPAPLAVLFHGNAMLAEDWIAWADELARGGWNVLLPEFRGYASSGGSPTRAGLVADAAEFVRLAAADPRVDASRIALYGRSIGGMVAAEAAVALAEAGAAPRSLVLHTTPARIADFAWRYGAPPFLVRQRFDAEGALAALRLAGPATRITVIGHTEDEIVPSSHTARLARAAGVEALEFRGSHNGIPNAREQAAAMEAIESGLSR